MAETGVESVAASEHATASGVQRSSERGSGGQKRESSETEKDGCGDYGGERRYAKDNENHEGMLVEKAKGETGGAGSVGSGGER